ncbi:uncharacterized protein [Antedon mediterranea]|uniref:uncharacterized protein n=1 Tax=Antedon mediterranea TaxID=105859 RepID=UPI003AF5D11B
MRQELHAITTANVAKGSEIHRFSISTSCFACGDTSEKISGGEVLCQFCLMILDNSSNWGLFFTDKGNLWQQAMEACIQSTMVQDSTSIISDSTPSTTDASLPQHTSEDKTSLCQVCGASASGLHFGVFTCEGCKCLRSMAIEKYLSS